MYRFTTCIDIDVAKNLWPYLALWVCRCNLSWLFDLVPILSSRCKLSLKYCLWIRIPSSFNSSHNITSPHLGNNEIKPARSETRSLLVISVTCCFLKSYFSIFRYTVRLEKRKMLLISEIRQLSLMWFGRASLWYEKFRCTSIIFRFLGFRSTHCTGMKFSIKYLVTFTEEILIGKLHF